MIRTIGTCRLTGVEGKYVKSHLLPRALTKPEIAGAKFWEHEVGRGRVNHRSDSWYDNQLVTQEGEDLLSLYDTRGITELRGLGMLWSSKLHSKLNPEILDPESGIGTLSFTTEHPDWIRLFVLSLLWRSAASQRPEFKKIALADNDLHYLGSLLRSGSIGDRGDFPINCVVLQGPGDPHNCGPLDVDFREHDPDSTLESRYRFYVDGLIFHICKTATDLKSAEKLGKMLVGHNRDFVTLSLPYEKSAQKEKLVTVIRDAAKVHQLEDFNG
jgi:hypothetical protein